MDAPTDPAELLARLTPREEAVLDTACTRDSIKEAAYYLGLSESQAKRTITSAYAKLGVNTLAGAARIYYGLKGLDGGRAAGAD